jgi:predicted ATP-dependent endonuclease of OLD family
MEHGSGRMTPGHGQPLVGIAELRLRGFRSARDALLRPGPVCALVGEAGAGKSNVLAAIWRLLDPTAPALAPNDATFGTGEAIELSARLTDGRRIELSAHPPSASRRSGPAVEVVFLPADLRGGLLAAPSTARISHRLRRATAAHGEGGSTGAEELVATVERLCAEGAMGAVLLIEEPELYLRPQAQRYFYRLLRTLAGRGNQVLYSTHAPAFLNVARLDELALVEHRGQLGTTIVQPAPLPADERFRALSEFDAERSELFLSRAALLVEGRTEKLVFPFVFRALGLDHDREAISIVECGGKPMIPIVARVCNATGIPFIVVHDRDAEAGRQPIASERAVNRQILAAAGPDRIVELVPDLEGVAGIRGHSHKPEHASRRFASISAAEVPFPLADAVTRITAAARA